MMELPVLLVLKEPTLMKNLRNVYLVQLVNPTTKTQRSVNVQQAILTMMELPVLLVLKEPTLMLMKISASFVDQVNPITKTPENVNVQ